MTKVLQVRLDSETKAAADRLYADLGLDTSTAVRMFLQASLQANGLPFAVKRAFNPETEAALQEARDIAAGKIKAKGYKSVEEMFAELDAEIVKE
ncbi:antitoxin RelB [Candidatus Termititenax aidoneus]|uniref:Antitoxin RelB n=1 Tax=Termititenax aidoneus TaxID=2218524 RepID=A0A388TCX8_TERA1|nr:antitoxin RelB [Candidatus Termititenax aidoneus]